MITLNVRLMCTVDGVGVAQITAQQKQTVNLPSELVQELQTALLVMKVHPVQARMVNVEQISAHAHQMSAVHLPASVALVQVKPPHLTSSSFNAFS